MWGVSGIHSFQATHSLPGGHILPTNIRSRRKKAGAPERKSCGLRRKTGLRFKGVPPDNA